MRYIVYKVGVGLMYYSFQATAYYQKLGPSDCVLMVPSFNYDTL